MAAGSHSCRDDRPSGYGPCLRVTGCNQRRLPVRRRSRASVRRPTYQGAWSESRRKRSRPSRDSPPTEEGSDRLRVPAAPRWRGLESSSCTARSMPCGAWESPRRETESRQVGEGRQPAHTTTPLLSPAYRSRRSCRFAKRCQVAPFVRSIDWLLVVGGVSGIDLGGAMLGHERAEGLIQQGRIVQIRPQAPRVLQEEFIDGRAHSYACHATTMPHQQTADKVPPGCGDRLASAKWRGWSCGGDGI